MQPFFIKSSKNFWAGQQYFIRHPLRRTLIQYNVIQHFTDHKAFHNKIIGFKYADRFNQYSSGSIKR